MSSLWHCFAWLFVLSLQRPHCVRNKREGVQGIHRFERVEHRAQDRLCAHPDRRDVVCDGDGGVFGNAKFIVGQVLVASHVERHAIRSAIGVFSSLFSRCGCSRETFDDTTLVISRNVDQEV